MSDHLSPAVTPKSPLFVKSPWRETPAHGAAPRKNGESPSAGVAAKQRDAADRRRDRKLDQALMDTFPASDPFSIG